MIEIAALLLKGSENVPWHLPKFAINGLQFSGQFWACDCMNREKKAKKTV